MVHLHYDLTLILGSCVVAFIICFIAVLLEQRVTNNVQQKKEKLLLAISGACLGFAIWVIHFVGMLACHLTVESYFDPALTIFSYIIAWVASSFAVWLTTRPTLPIPRLVLGSVLMGLGIAGMHYTGMLGFIIPQHIIQYDPMWVLVSILVAITGSGFSFWLAFKLKRAYRHELALKIAIALTMTFSIVGMHYIGMGAVSIHKVIQYSADYLSGNSWISIITIGIVTILILVSVFSIAILEQRLEHHSSRLKKAEHDLRKQAYQDHLTKLPNRQYLSENMQKILDRQQVTQKKLFCISIDLDRFKSVNDVFGPQVGDQLLMEVAKRISLQLSPDAQLFRLGGDRFFLVDLTVTENGLERYVEYLKRVMQRPFFIDGNELNVTMSMGIVSFPEHGQNFEELLIHAESALLMAKLKGRNGYCIFSHTTEFEQQKNQLKLMHDMHKAIEQQQFELFYQPKFDAVQRKMCGVEALIRWNHPELGLLTPGLFIESAEKSGLIIEIGYWALEQACRQIAEWETQQQNQFLPIAVNLSALQFEHQYLFKTLDTLLKKYQIQPQNLMVEITESTAMQHIEKSMQSFDQLRTKGIQLAIDDFGTGYSSFVYLKKLPVHELKIDREFILDLRSGSKDELIIESIITLATKLGLTVTAEGVETQEQADILTQLGCQQLQGYLMAKPMSVMQLKVFSMHEE